MRQTIAETVERAEDVEDEMRHLMEVISKVDKDRLYR